MQHMLCFAAIAMVMVVSASMAAEVTASYKAVEDLPYGQTFSRQDQFIDLPFDAVTDSLYDANGYCFVALTTNPDTPLWSAKKRVFGGTGDSVVGTESPYTVWRAIEAADEQTTLPNGESFLKILKAPDSILLISASSVVEIVVDFNCTTLVSVRTLVEQPSSTIGEIISASYADMTHVESESPYASSIWLGTSNGLFSISPQNVAARTKTTSPWSMVQISEISGPVSSLLWVPKWNRLFAGTAVALYELDFDLGIEENRLHSSITQSYKVHYQWIGGNLDFEVKDMSYDYTLDCMWVVQQEALHQRRADGTWWRQGHYQGLITNNITTVTITQNNFQKSLSQSRSTHFVWVGTTNKGIMRHKVQHSEEGSGNDDTAQDDPWQTWLLFYGARFLPDGEVILMVSDDNNDKNKHVGRQESTVLVVSGTGLTLLTTQEWTLRDKEAVMQSYQYPRHDRHGIVAEVSLPVPGDTTQWSHNCEDSDSIWTAQYAVAASMRYAVTRLPSDRVSAWKTFEGLEKLAQLSGIPGLVGRTFCSPEEVAGLGENGRTGGCGVDGEGNWHNSPTMKGWVWKGDTSSDTINGHYYAYGVVLDMVAETNDEQARVYKCIDDITSYIVDNDFYYIDVNGEPTKWGRWNPADLNENSDFYSERGLNSLEILAFLALGYSVTGKEEFLVNYQSLSLKYGYYDNVLNQKIDNPFEDNHSDNELGQMAYHTLFYSLYRLQLALDKGKVPYNIKDLNELKSRCDVLRKLVSPVIPSIQRWWSIVKHERSPLWLSLVAGVAGVHVSSSEKERAIQSLQLYSSDLIGWSVHNSGRWDCIEQPYYGRDNPDNLLMRNIRPPQERILGHYNIDPFALDSSHEATDAYSGGAGGGVEYSPAEWLLPYWSLRFYDLLE